jgi:hypothetical protein
VDCCDQGCKQTIDALLRGNGLLLASSDITVASDDGKTWRLQSISSLPLRGLANGTAISF